MVLVAVVGSSPGIGKSVLCAALARWLERAGLKVDHFEEHHVLTRPSFSAVAADFTDTGTIRADELVDATVRYLSAAAAEGVDVVVMDMLIPYVPTLLACGHDERGIAEIVSTLAGRISPIETLVVFLDGDPSTALERAATREGPGWLGWYAAKLHRYGLIASPASEPATLVAYLARERDITLRVLRAQPWRLLVLEHVDRRSPDEVLELVTTALPCRLGPNRAQGLSWFGA